MPRGERSREEPGQQAASQETPSAARAATHAKVSETRQRGRNGPDTITRGAIGAETAQGGTIARGGGHQWWVDGGRSVVLCFVTGVELGRAEAARVRENGERRSEECLF